MFGKAKHKDSQPVLFYHLTQPEALRQKIVSIVDGGTTHFRSHAFTLPGKSGVTWIEAKKTDSGLWQVTEYKIRMKVRSQAIRLAQSCFFDALHYCARFEAEKDITLDMTEALDAAATAPHHIRDAARRACQPFDINNLPCPAADGAALTSCDLMEEEHALACRAPAAVFTELAGSCLQSPVSKIRHEFAQASDFTRQQLTPAEEPQEAAPDEEKSRPAAALSAADKLRIKALTAEKKKLCRVQKGLDNLFYIFATQVEQDFQLARKEHPAGNVILSLFPPYLALYGVGYFLGLTDTGVERSLKVATDKAISSRMLAPSPEKEEIDRIIPLAHAAFHLEYAAAIARRCAAGKLKASFRANEGVAQLEKACDLLNKTGDGREKMKEEYLAGQFPTESKHFFNEIWPLGNAVYKSLARRVNKIDDEIKAIEYPPQTITPKLHL